MYNFQTRERRHEKKKNHSIDLIKYRKKKSKKQRKACQIKEQFKMAEISMYVSNNNKHK